MLFLTKIWTMSHWMAMPRCSAFQTPPPVDICAPNFTCQKPVASQLFRLVQQRGDAGEQPARRTTIEHTMVEAERKICFHHRDELAFLLVPTRHQPPRPHAQHNGLFRQRNRRRPRQTERSEI